jgi:hypothetical protein
MRYDRSSREDSHWTQHPFPIGFENKRFQNQLSGHSLQKEDWLTHRYQIGPFSESRVIRPEQRDLATISRLIGTTSVLLKKRCYVRLF